MANLNKAPDYTVASNPHCMIHCGPIGPESGDDKRDLTIVTSSNSEMVYGKNGNKSEHITGAYSEVSGHQIDPEQKDAVARAIIAKNGDIILIAESGNIRMRAKNIFMEAIAPNEDVDGEKQKMGNVNIYANGQCTIASGDEIRLAAGNICSVAEKGFQLVGDFTHSGKMMEGGPTDTASLLSSMVAGNWGSILTAITKSCG